MSSCVVNEKKDEGDVCQTDTAHACFFYYTLSSHPSSALLHLAVIPMESHEPRPLIFIRVLTQLPSFLIVLGLFRAMVQQELSHLLHLSASSETHHATERAYISRAWFDVRWKAMDFQAKQGHAKPWVTRECGGNTKGNGKTKTRQLGHAPSHRVRWRIYK